MLIVVFLLSFIVLMNPFNSIQSNTDSTPFSKTASSVKVVVTLSIIGDWAQNIAGDLVTIESIVSGLENPHTYDPSASDVAKVAEADLFIRFGLSGLEPWVNSLISANVGLADKTLTLIEGSEYMVYDPIIDALNPHVWMDPNNADDMTYKIYQQLADLDSVNEQTYHDNYLEYEIELNNLLARINDSKVLYEGVKVVTHHPSFKYLLDLLGIQRIGAIEEKEGVEPSAAHIADLTQDMITQGCNLIINQPQLDIEDVEALALETSSSIAILTPLLGVINSGELEDTFGVSIDSYIEMIDYNLYQLGNPYTPEPRTSLVPGFELVFFLLVVPVLRWKSSKK